MNVEFQEEQVGTNIIKKTKEKRRGSLVNFIIKLGLAKSSKGANIILLGLAVVAVIAALLVLYLSIYDSPPREVRLRDIPQDIRDNLPQEILDSLPR